MNFKLEKFYDMNYVLRYPDNYKEGEKYPVIIFLHGSGTRGNDINMLVNNQFFEIINTHEDFPFIIAAPQCSKNTWFDMFEQLKSFACKISDESFTDKDRIYLMGASMGGYGTWQLAMSMPEMFAAAVPICGGGMYWNAYMLVNVPVWAFHGDEDDIVYKEESIKMVDAVNKYGGCAKLTIYPKIGHGSWADTYHNREVFDWLLSNTNKNTIELIDKFNDGAKHG